MFKNVASQKLIVFAFDATTNLPKTGDAGNITAYVSKDYGSVTVLGDTSATEMDSTNAKGYYLFDLTQGETNADCLMFSAKSSTANIVVIGVPAVVFTDPPNYTAAAIDSSGRVQVQVGTSAGQINSSSGKVPATIAAGDLANNSVTAAAIADGAIDRATFAADTGLQTIRSNTAVAGSSTSITFDAGASSTDNFYRDMLVKITGGTGVGQTRLIRSYTGSTQIALVAPQWLTNPDNTSTFAILDFGQVDVYSIGHTQQTARDIGSSVLISSGTGTGQLQVTSGVIDANVQQFGGQAGTFASGIPDVNVAKVGGTSQTAGDIIADTNDIQSRLPAALVSGRMDSSVGGYQTGQAPLQPTTAGRTLDVSAGGEAGVDWANVGSPTTSVNLSGTTVKTATDVEADTQDIQSRLPAALVSGRIDASVGATQTDAISAAGVSAGAANKVADHTMRRTTANVEASSNGDTLGARSLYGAAARLAHKVSISGSTLTVTKSDDTTSLTTESLSSLAGADPITAKDPA